MIFGGYMDNKWKNSDPDVHRDAVKKLDDQKILAEIAKNDEDIEVRRAAVEKLDPEKWQDFLTDIAKSKYLKICKAAMKKLVDQNLIADVAKNAENWEIRSEAVEKLEDQEALAWVAKNDEIGWVRKAAVEKLDPDRWQDLIVDIAKNDKRKDVRIEAEYKLKDKATKIKVFVVPHVRSAQMAARYIETLYKSKISAFFAISVQKEGKRILELRNVKNQKVGLDTLSGHCIIFVPKGAPVDLLKESPELSEVIIKMDLTYSKREDLDMMDLMVLSID